MLSIPLVSIIINNYNYGRFLPAAIESALAQTYANVEVIVVDDGSTDTSHEVLGQYTGRITPVLKGNGGQASTFNAGFAQCQGSIVLFLDADDTLHPAIVERVVQVFRDQPNTAKVQFRLELVDAHGASLGICKPTNDVRMPNGDLRQHVLTFPDDIPWQPTSGNAFSASVLRQILPMPEEMYRICADYYLSNIPPLFGPIISLEEVGGYYRLHATNNHHKQMLDLDQTRQIIIRTGHTHRYIQQYAFALGLIDPISAPLLSVTLFAHRIISLKLEPAQHPVENDTALGLVRLGSIAALRRFDLPVPMRFVYILWFASVLLMPKPGVVWLAQLLFYPETWGQLRRMLSVLQRKPRYAVR